MRRIQMLKGHDDYLRRRDEVGDNGCYGREYAVLSGAAGEARRRNEFASDANSIVGETPLPIPIISS